MSINFYVLPRSSFPAVEEVSERLAKRLREEGWSGEVEFIRVERGEATSFSEGDFEEEVGYTVSADEADTTVVISVERYDPKVYSVEELVDDLNADVTKGELIHLAVSEKRFGHLQLSSTSERTEEEKTILKWLLISLAEGCDGRIACPQRAFDVDIGIFKPEELEPATWVLPAKKA